MNIYDVSEKAQVSIATVSRVLNGNPNVSEKTRRRVLQVMDELGYTPNVFARGLGLGTMKTIGIMCSDSSDPYLANAIYYLERELRNNNYDSILCCTGNMLETKKKYFDLLRSKRVDALILAGSQFIESKAKDNSYILDAAKELPIMLVNGFLEGENIYCTVCDDVTATYQAADLLIKSGKKKILYLYNSPSYSGLNKLQGFKNALRDNQVDIDDSYIHLCPKDLISAKDMLVGLHDSGLHFDAVLTAADELAVGAVKYAHVKGLKIPDQLSIVGYNNSIYSLCTDPEITSVDNKVEALCTTTINTLMGVFNGGNVPSKTTVAADLIKRDTTNF